MMREIETCREALEYRRLLLRESTPSTVADNWRQEKESAIDAALSWLDAQMPQPATQGLDFPDSSGWWGGIQRGREFVVHFIEYRVSGNKVFVRWADDDYTMEYDLDWFKMFYRDTKFYRLHMPWEANNE